MKSPSMKSMNFTSLEQYLRPVKGQGRLRKKDLQKRNNMVTRGRRGVPSLNRSATIIAQGEMIHKESARTIEAIVVELNLAGLTIVRIGCH
jgi:hypothetical protein